MIMFVLDGDPIVEQAGERVVHAIDPANLMEIGLKPERVALLRSSRSQAGTACLKAGREP